MVLGLGVQYDIRILSNHVLTTFQNVQFQSNAGPRHIFQASLRHRHPS